MTPGYLAPDEYDLLSLIADEHTVPGADAVDLFLAACEADAKAHGWVSVPRVRLALAGADIPPARLSSLWGHFTGDGKPMRRIEGCFDDNDGGTIRNGNKTYPRRKWVG
ncbi:hypothetical protein [Nocardioides terrisoli]|uniref:hypothetical protein n=1 Tax=Nocardioides terrisoli TaxID=3388267 RepID=UPI00287BB95A|nr:hypothetical protein [Nocardioides marmorisolisilvae]